MRVTFDAAVLGVWSLQSSVESLRLQVIDVPAATALDHLYVVPAIRFAEHPVKGRPTVPTGEVVVLAAQEACGHAVHRLALAVGEHQTADNDGHERQPLCDGAGERGLECIDRVLLWARAGLGVDRQSGKEHQRWNRPPPALHAQSPEVRPSGEKRDLHGLLLSFASPASEHSPLQRLERSYARKGGSIITVIPGPTILDSIRRRSMFGARIIR
jgi:hypothetical protein